MSAAMSAAVNAAVSAARNVAMNRARRAARMRWRRAATSVAALSAAVMATLLAGCALPPSSAVPAPAAVQPVVWHAPLPAGGAAGDLIATAQPASWWASFGDPVLPSLIEAAHAQGASASLSAAAARIEAARAARVAAGSALVPRLDAAGSVARARSASVDMTGCPGSHALPISMTMEPLGARRVLNFFARLASHATYSAPCRLPSSSILPGTRAGHFACAATWRGNCASTS